MPGNSRSGNRSSNRGRRPRFYMTNRRRLELAHWEAKQARLKAERHQAALARARAKARERGKARTAANKAARVAGLPLPYPERCRHGGKDKPGASTPRWRRFIECRRILLIAWDAAIRENRRRDRRVAKGLPPVPPTHAQRQADYLKRKAAEKAFRLASSWWSEDIPEGVAKEQIRHTHPTLDEMSVHVQYGWLVQQCRMWRLNVNRFTISEDGQDGIATANQARAIFDYIQKATNNTDHVAVLKAASLVADFAGLVGDINAQNKAIVAAGERWGNGAAISRAVGATK
jgi:hypothetical protein